MTEKNDISEKPTLVAIDIAKHRNDVLIQPSGKKRYRMIITNDRVDHDRLIVHLVRLKGPVSVGFEATGDYHRAIAVQDARRDLIGQDGGVASPDDPLHGAVLPGDRSLSQ